MGFRMTFLCSLRTGGIWFRDPGYGPCPLSNYFFWPGTSWPSRTSRAKTLPGLTKDSAVAPKVVVGGDYG